MIGSPAGSEPENDASMDGWQNLALACRSEANAAIPSGEPLRRRFCRGFQGAGAPISISAIVLRAGMLTAPVNTPFGQSSANSTARLRSRANRGAFDLLSRV